MSAWSDLSEEERAARNARNKEYREANKEQLASKARLRRAARWRADVEASRAAERERYASDPRVRERTVAAATARRRADPDAAFVNNRDRQMWRKFKRTPEDYERVLGEQGGVCDTCRRAPYEVTKTGRTRQFAWDHDRHCCPGEVSCGECVRGLLCTPCNTRVGVLESPMLLTFLDYLEKYQ